jgi:class 3 adenylate cyclase/tetratricopeptide (TPR) repeat protein
MPRCPSCGQENPEGFRFCGACGSQLAEGPPAAREERKVLTVVFCDLVGSTARAERMDPEDVRDVLSRYHGQVRRDLERFGGTVEKYIGDAIMALFGAPVAHEDDPERAVRAALAIRDRAGEADDLHVRIGITTGEALVALDTRPDRGESMAAGDVVNTAARLQAAAPVDGILVDETTFRATDRVIEYTAAASVEAKGKEHAVAVWQPVQARSRFGVDVRQIGATPLVGRKRELTVLTEALARAKEERSPQLVSLVGVPGIGKSRMVWELFRHVERGGELVTWRQGRSLPYGEGVALWALGEIVKAQAGILETDAEPNAAAKLERSVRTLVEDERDAAWVLRHLAPLVGAEAATAEAGRRDEAFAAWRRFLEALAARRPLVLVFEDLHFADDGLLDFVDHLVDWASGVPLLVLATARPELLARRPAWGGGKPDAVTVTLSALSADETAELAHALLERPVLDAELQEALLERAGGNPLYAEEFVRLIAAGRAPAEVPETVHGVIAARLDLLPVEEKAALQDAAVLGKVFWLGAVAALGAGGRWTLEQRMHALERKEFVRRERTSSVAGETEYAFRHVLVRDVAYKQIPRRERVQRHLGAAAWLESLGRPEDHAELLAHHYLSALELARATGGDTARFAEPARLALRDAGDRALALHAYPSAVRFYEAAAKLWPAGDAELPELSFRLGRALAAAADDRADEAIERARDALVAAGARGRAAEASTVLAELWWYRGRRQQAREHVDDARRLVAGEAVSESKARVLVRLARHLALAGENESAVAVGSEARELGELLHLDDVRAHVLCTIGLARFQMGDVGGVDDAEQAVEIARTSDLPEVARAYHNLGHLELALGHIRRSRDLRRASVAAAQRFGEERQARWAGASEMTYRYAFGNWDAAVQQALAFLEESERLGGWYQDAFVLAFLAVIATARGEDDHALAWAHGALDRAEKAADPQVVVTTHAHVALVEAELGNLDPAREDAKGALLVDHRFPIAGVGRSEAVLAPVASLLGIESQLRVRIADAPPEDLWAPAVRAMLDGDYAAAAGQYHELELLPFEAHARLLAAERFYSEGRFADAVDERDRALAFWRSVGAARYVARAELLMPPPVETRAG